MKYKVGDFITILYEGESVFKVIRLSGDDYVTNLISTENNCYSPFIGREIYLHKLWVIKHEKKEKNEAPSD